MPYKCVHCSNIYNDGSGEILTGCSNCKSKFFFYIKKEKLDEIKKAEINSPSLTEQEKNQIEKDIREIVGVEDEDQPVFLDFESVKVIKPGKYLVDVSRLFEDNGPKIYQLEDGKYIIDLS